MRIARNWEHRDRISLHSMGSASGSRCQNFRISGASSVFRSALTSISGFSTSSNHSWSSRAIRRNHALDSDFLAANFHTCVYGMSELSRSRLIQGSRTGEGFEPPMRLASHSNPLRAAALSHSATCPQLTILLSLPWLRQRIRGQRIPHCAICSPWVKRLCGGRSGFGPRRAPRSLEISPRTGGSHMRGWGLVSLETASLSKNTGYGYYKIFTIYSPSRQGAFVGQSPMQVVPASSQLLQRFSKLLWNSLLPTAVKTEFQGQPAFAS
jgi:hypothetical protein